MSTSSISTRFCLTDDFAYSKASHPVVRTNPVTGWKSLFALGGQVEHGWIDGVTNRESEILKNHFLDLIVKNRTSPCRYVPGTYSLENVDDLQVRFRWNKNDLAIWDNRQGLPQNFRLPFTNFTRSVFHTATNDYYGKRSGNRVVSLGERPFFDPKSKSRREDLNAQLLAEKAAQA